MDFWKFISELESITPNNSVLRLGGVNNHEIESFLEKNPSVYENELDTGFFGMGSKTYFMPINKCNLQNFLYLTELYTVPEVCDELQAYWNDKLILSWHDLPFDPIYVWNKIDERVLKGFSESLSCDFVFADKAV